METLSTRMGPTDVGSGSGTSSVSVGDLLDRRDWLLTKHQEEKDRVQTVTNIANGDWYIEWPDLSQTSEAPTVANTIEMGIGHWSSIGGAVLPSIRVPVGASESRSQGMRGARKRERRLRELWAKSNMSELMAQFWADYAGAGFAVMGVWVNFDEKDKKKRDPYIVRYDPRHTYTILDENGDVAEMLVARKFSGGELRARYYGRSFVNHFSESNDEDVEEWFWYKPDKLMHIIADTSKDGRKGQRWQVLTDVENPFGCVPVVEVVRPTFDGQRRGMFDQAIHLLRTMQRLMILTIESTEENSFPTIVEYDTVNPEDFRPGGIVHKRSADSTVERMGPSAHFDVKDLIARLGEEASQAAVFPRQLTGDPGASIVSARGISASMGALDARLAVAHKQFEVGCQKISKFLLMADEKFCYGEKTITGDWRDKSPAEKYDPRTDVNGAYEVRCTYGIGAGSDPNNIEVRLNMNLAAGLISQETAREQLPFLEEPDREPLRIMREGMQQALLAGVLAQAQQGQPAPAAEALKLLDKEDASMDEVIEKLVEFLAPPEPQGGDMGMGGALGAMQGAESLARGGIPGSAEQAPPGLPPLGAMLGQDARYVS